ncbi:GNAT family N-acetyltransferase [Paracoccus stylophorae]|uniref:GNAT family N-acetyltransferase n=1 Tax=Paracoccus stylophorae TaxID=659350 RepID=A0ABY7SXR7_9RHOB|nr:GNAT family N-acetyltransferase [Paracoccus stylophorae]WCR11673.1 GNAT family N-acetyltransferase [Paracoccus stylophorae]
MTPVTARLPRSAQPDTAAPLLRTARLTLRLPDARDLDAYAAFFADAQASHFYGGPLRRDQAFGVLCRDIGHWSLRGYGKFAVTRNGATIGGCGIVHPDGWPGRELTWWLLPDARGQGLAREASVAVLAWARDALASAEVETHFRDDNDAALRLTRSLGGRRLRRAVFPDGVARDIHAIPTDGVAA